MGNWKGKLAMKPYHKRSAGLHSAGTTITDPTDWCMAYADNDEDYNRMKAVYESCTDQQKGEICELLSDEGGMCFDNRERMQSHFSGLGDEDFVNIKQGLVQAFPDAFN